MSYGDVEVLAVALGSYGWGRGRGRGRVGVGVGVWVGVGVGVGVGVPAQHSTAAAHATHAATQLPAVWVHLQGGVRASEGGLRVCAGVRGGARGPMGGCWGVVYD